MRCCVNPYLNWHRKYERSKLKIPLSFCKFRRLSFDLSYIQCQLRYRFTQYLIFKVSLLVLRIFPYKMAIFTMVKKIPKHSRKTAILSAPVCTCVTSFSIEFWLQSFQLLWSCKPSPKVHFSIAEKWKLKVCNSKTRQSFGTKTH